MSSWWRYPLQALNYFIFMAVVGYFSVAPPYRHLAGDQAQVTLAFGHAGQPREPCRTLTAEELAKLPPNMRKPTDCPRARSPIQVELFMDGKPLLRVVAKSPGLFEDGSVDIFRSLRVPAGRHSFQVRMNDNSRVEGFTHSAEYQADLLVGKLLVIDFNPENGFLFR